MPQVHIVHTSAPCIVSVSDDGQVEVRLADGERRVLQVPIEQVEQLRRAAFAEHQQRHKQRWLGDVG